jgi:hypothetical protein
MLKPKELQSKGKPMNFWANYNCASLHTSKAVGEQQQMSPPLVEGRIEDMA